MAEEVVLPRLNIQEVLRTHGIRPERDLGQNFLVDDSTARKIVAAAYISKEDVVLEIGPGLGSLTRYLSLAARRVIAVELDTRLIPVLQELLASFQNVRILHADILKVNPIELISESGADQGQFLVVANIPYYITSAVIRHLIDSPARPARIVLTVQREVAQRIIAGPGKLSTLALSVQVFGAPQVVVRIPAGSFYPSPKVDSVAVRIDLYPEPLIPTPDLATFFKLVKAGFSQKRKTLRNALSAGLGSSAASIETLLRSALIDPNRRAESLSIEEWRQLVDKYLQSA